MTLLKSPELSIYGKMLHVSFKPFEGFSLPKLAIYSTVWGYLSGVQNKEKIESLPAVSKSIGNPVPVQVKGL